MPMSAQVRNVVALLERQGFEVRSRDDGSFEARRQVPHGLIGVRRIGTPASMWVLFAGWPWRRGTLAELRGLGESL